MIAEIGREAPELCISEWVQGMPTSLAEERDKIVLVEVFQVNCPGCFMYGIPEAMAIYSKYAGEGVRVLGLATAFEDYDKNTIGNLRLLLESGTVIGDTLRGLGQYGQLEEGRLAYRIPFPVAMDSLIKETGKVSDSRALEFARRQIPDFESRPEAYRNDVMQRVREYYATKEYSAETFEGYALQGTPSAILVDRKGILRSVSFGQSVDMDSAVQKLLRE